MEAEMWAVPRQRADDVSDVQWAEVASPLSFGGYTRTENALLVSALEFFARLRFGGVRALNCMLYSS
jgi:hypothetical protein